MSREPSLKLVQDSVSDGDLSYRRSTGELWTAQQRQMHSLHYVVSYRASFKPELPDFCVRRYSEKGQVVFDPFSGRGTTALQANLLGRVAWGSDVNPLSVRMTRAKTNPAALDEIVLRLNQVEFLRPVTLRGYQQQFEPFYHPDTYRELLNLRAFVQNQPDRINNFIELISLSRLHGHSPGFFSVYSFPQISIPAESQRNINRKRHQEPEYRAVAPRIIRKASQALRDGFTREFFDVSAANRFEVGDARNCTFVPANSVDLVVTSPPFLDKVDYVTDNWLECWFCGIDLEAISASVMMLKEVEQWRIFMRDVMAEMLRMLRPRASAVIEVGEVEVNGKILNLDEVVAAEAEKLSTEDKRFVVDEVLVNEQKFTKLAHCFNVDNNEKGTNTNRLVVLTAAPKRKRSVPRRAAKEQLSK